MTPDEFPCPAAEDRRLWLGAWLFVALLALFLNSLFINL